LHTKHMLSRPLRAKSGMSTVLGTLFFVGILFTSVIPLFLYVNKVNSYYDTAVTEMRQFDQDRERERIDVYAYPFNKTSSQINVYIKNRCPLSVKIVRVWVNDDKFEFSFEIPAMGDGTIENIEIQIETKAYYITVMTARGNTFSSYTNPLYYTVGEGWSGGMGFTIQVVIQTSTQATRFFKVNVTGPSSFTYHSDVLKRPHESSCLAVVTVTLEGEYHVRVKEGTNSIPVTPEYVYVDFGTPSRWVYANAG